MHPDRRASSTGRGLLLPLLAVLLPLGWFLLDGRLKIDLADEGFLWYGTVALRRGLVPMRDFQAYDPGRYVWTGAWSLLFGESLVAVRLACALFQCLGVAAGLLVARRVSSSPVFLAATALVLCAWMHPRYKVFEPALALMALYAAVRLLERPAARTCLLAGLLGGVSACFGRNHGAYHMTAFALLLAWTSRRGSPRGAAGRWAAWAGGILLGYLPMLAAMALVPGFAGAFAGSIAEILEKGTNLPLPVRWPWRVPAGLPAWKTASALADGAFFLAIPVFLALAGWSLLRRRQADSPRAAPAAALAVLLPYAHHVFSRPDGVHLGPGVVLLALGIPALAGASRRTARALAASLALLAATVPATFFRASTALEVASRPNAFEEVDVAGCAMRVSTYNARLLASARELADRLAAPGEPILFAPHQPGLYPFTGRLSPTWRIYFILTASPEEDERLAEEIEASGVRWAMVRDYALDGREDLRFTRTHPRTAEELRTGFEPVRLGALPPDVVLLRLRADR